MDNFYIITGGPGVGKTTLLDALMADGFTVIPEAAREIIREQEQIKGKGVPWEDNGLYTELMLSQSVKDYREATSLPLNEPVFFDRGIPDSLCHWELSGNPITAEMEECVQKYRYNPTVFILPPWKEIYHMDNERKQSWKEAEPTFHKMMEIYERYGYNTVIVPKDTIENRKQFVINRIKANKALIRKMLPSEYSLLEDIMYEAIYHPDPANPYPKEVIYYPQVRAYWDNWGTGKDDDCLVATVDNQIAGAVWIRTFHGELKGCGYIDESTPEIAIALFEPYHNQGIGTRMMEQMIASMKTKGYTQVSLSITKGNPAIRLYERLGFVIVDENEEDNIMLLRF